MMKKKFLILILAVGIATSAVAQQKNAIGLRFGGDNMVEVNYQRFFSEKNRLELGLGLPYAFSGVALTGAYHWIFQPSVFPKGLDWYVGPGAQVGFWSKFVNVAVVGQIGLGYTFTKVPIQLTLDYRPAVGVAIGNPTGLYGGWFGFGFGVRYKF